MVRTEQTGAHLRLGFLFFFFKEDAAAYKIQAKALEVRARTIWAPGGQS